LFLRRVLRRASRHAPGCRFSEPNPLNDVYLGERHMYTSASPDAFAFGTRNEAYRFAIDLFPCETWST
jgi:hypothetical protein